MIKTNRFDDYAWKGSRATTPTTNLVNDLFIGDVHRGGEREGFEPAVELVEGLFHSFYKADPLLADKRELERDLYPVRKILEDLQENDRLQDLHNYTYTDATMSTIAMTDMAGTLQELLLQLQKIDPPPPPGGQGEGQQGGQQSGQSDGQSGDQEPSDQGEQGDEEGQEEGQGEGQPGEGESDDLSDQAEADWEAAYDEMLDELNVDSYVDQAIDEAIDGLEEFDRRRRNAGLEAGQWETMTPDQRLETADWLMTEEMKDLSDMIGQMKRFALGVKAERIIDTPTEAYDVELGNNLSNVLKGQYAWLGHEMTKIQFYKLYLDRRLLQFKKRGKQEVGKGPLEVCIDKSYSMEGKPFHWAMGVAEALRRFAADESRDYHAMFFGTNDDRTHFDFPKGLGPFEKLRAFLSAKANGGTAFDGVLTDALRRAAKSHDQEGRSKADIVFITDGRAKLSDAWVDNFNEERTRIGVRVFSVFIGGASDKPSPPVALLERISDLTISVADLKPEAARQIFAVV